MVSETEAFSLISGPLRSFYVSEVQATVISIGKAKMYK